MGQPQPGNLSAGALSRLRWPRFYPDPLLPYGIESTGHTWLHSRCWPAWYETPKARASAALSAMGITVPVDHDMGSEHNVPLQTKRRSSAVGERGQEEKA